MEDVNQRQAIETYVRILICRTSVQVERVTVKVDEEWWKKLKIREDEVILVELLWYR